MTLAVPASISNSSMATDLSSWNSDDCIKFVQQTMKKINTKVSDEDMERVISSLRSNHVTGSTLMKLTDDEWRELISSSMGLRIHIREAFKAVIKAEEKAAMSQLHRRGLPKQPQDKTEKMFMHPIIATFFSKANVPALPDESVQHDIDQSSRLEPVSIVNLNSVTEFIQYLLSKKDSTFSSLILRKAVLQFLSLHNDNIRRTATKMASLCVSSGDKTSAGSLDQWRSKIKYFKKQDLDDINLEEYIVHFKANGELLNKGKRSASSTVRQSALPVGRRPVMVVAPESNVEPQMAEEASEDVEEIAPSKKRTRQCYSASQIEILHRESENGSARRRNADIAREISGLDGAREVTTQDVRNWFGNTRFRSRCSDE